MVLTNSEKTHAGLKNSSSHSLPGLKKSLLVFALTGTLVASLAGCSAALPAATKNSATPKPSATVSALCNPANDVYGDSVAEKPVKDELGAYCKTVINPKASALKKDVSKYDMVTLKDNGFTEDQAYEAQKTIVTFVANQALDSSALDTNTPGTVGNDDAGLAWYAANSNLIDSSAQDVYKNSGDLVPAGIVLTGYLPPLIRDGKTRVNKTSIEVTSVYAGKSTINNLPQIDVSIKFKVSYRATVDNTVKWLASSNGQTVEKVIEGSPELASKVGDKNILITGDTVYAVNPLNQKINGSNAKYTMNYKTLQGLGN